jgi:hypothetical protein
MGKTYKNLTKMQVETAEQVLRDALQNRTAEITKTKETAARKKHDTAMKSLLTETKQFMAKVAKIKKTIEKDDKFFLILGSDTYSNPFRDLEKKLNADELLHVKRKDGRSYGESVFTPDTTKEEAIIKNFILELKLGTAVMEDLKTILDVIKSIK